MDPVIKAGICGFVITVIIIFFSPVYLYFFPSFVASIIAIYFFELKATKDGVLAALIIYIFPEWILGAVNLLGNLISNEPINYTYTVDLWMFLSQIFIPLTALLAGLIGSSLAETRRVREYVPVPVPPPPSTLPASPPLVLNAKSEEKKFCRYCGGQNHNDAVFCEVCGKRIA